MFLTRSTKTEKEIEAESLAKRTQSMMTMFFYAPSLDSHISPFLKSESESESESNHVVLALVGGYQLCRGARRDQNDVGDGQ